MAERQSTKSDWTPVHRAVESRNPGPPVLCTPTRNLAQHSESSSTRALDSRSLRCTNFLVSRSPLLHVKRRIQSVGVLDSHSPRAQRRQDLTSSGPLPTLLPIRDCADRDVWNQTCASRGHPAHRIGYGRSALNGWATEKTPKLDDTTVHRARTNERIRDTGSSSRPAPKLG